MESGEAELEMKMRKEMKTSYPFNFICVVCFKTNFILFGLFSCFNLFGMMSEHLVTRIFKFVFLVYYVCLFFYLFQFGGEEISARL